MCRPGAAGAWDCRAASRIPPYHDMLCEKCQERDATFHTTTIIGDVSKTTDLCRECFESSGASFAKGLAQSLHGTRCQYCGAPATIGTMDHLALGTGEQHMMRFCNACSTEFNGYTMLALKQCPEGLSQQEQLEAMRQLREDAEQHMKQWVSKRQSQ